MTRIGFYSEQMNPKVKTYAGLYSLGNIVDYLYSNVNNVFKKLLDWFFNNSRDGQDIEYTEENWGKIIELYHNLKIEKWKGKLIAFTDEKQLNIPDFDILGYDICADSMYYSPLGDGFLLEYTPEKEFFSDMSIEMYSKFKDNINENWLFNSFDVATEFAQYCNYINKEIVHCIESEENWRPFAIYIFNQ